MYAPASPTPAYEFNPASAASLGRTEIWRTPRLLPGPQDPFVALVRNHHRAIFHLAHALLRDEIAAERITQQVFSRARRRLGQGTEAVTEWIYYASFRFVRMFHWRSIGLIARRRMRRILAGREPVLDLKTLVRVIARQSGKVDPHDCELLGLRYVLGMPVSNIAQLLRMQPCDVANRLTWAFERVTKLSVQAPVENERHADLALSA